MEDQNEELDRLLKLQATHIALITALFELLIDRTSVSAADVIARLDTIADETAISDLGDEGSLVVEMVRSFVLTKYGMPRPKPS